jgi:hypothetical protein
MTKIFVKEGIKVELGFDQTPRLEVARIELNVADIVTLIAIMGVVADPDEHFSLNAQTLALTLRSLLMSPATGEDVANQQTN